MPSRSQRSRAARNRQSRIEEDDQPITATVPSEHAFDVGVPNIALNSDPTEPVINSDPTESAIHSEEPSPHSNDQAGVTEEQLEQARAGVNTVIL